MSLRRTGTDLGTAFGPANVAIHRVAVAIEPGDAREAVQRVPDVNLGRLPPHLGERRARFLIDVARSHAQVQDDAAAIGALTEAEGLVSHGGQRSLILASSRRHRHPA